MTLSKRVHVSLMALLLFCLPACIEEMQGSILDDEPMNRTGETKKFFIPRPEEMVHDEATGLTTVKNVINLTFQKGTDRARIDTIIATVNGKIVGYDIPASMYQVWFDGLDLPAIDAIRMRLLGAHREVEVASRFFVSVHKDPYYAK